MKAVIFREAVMRNVLKI